MLKKRGNVWWYRFQFQGRLIRESAKTGSKTLAREAERQRRQELARAYNRIPRRRERMPMLSDAANEWLAGKTGLAPKSYRAYKDRLVPLKAAFGERLVCDISLADIASYQAARLAAGMSARTINYDILALRGILKAHGLWAELQDRVKNLRVNQDVGRAISPEDESKIIAACGASPTPAILPLFIVAVDTGLRAAELRALRCSDLSAQWAGPEMTTAEVRVGKSKTEAGAGRVVPLSARARAVLAGWLVRLPDRRGSDYIFPRHRVGIGGNARRPVVRVVDAAQPMQEWKNAWASVCRSAGVHYRWHDCRHTFISRLAESPDVSEGTIMALAGHVSKAMLARYSHIRVKAKQEAIAVLERNAAALPSLSTTRQASRGAVN
ncbi:MAG: tyrosine-type recombinase/integrase [Terriglobales bacterium]